MRFFLFGNRGYLSVVLESLLAEKQTIVGVCTETPPQFLHATRSRCGRVLRKLRLKGRNDFIVKDPFSYLKYPWEIARTCGVNIFSVDQLKSTRLLSYLQKENVDVILVAGFPRLIPEKVYQCGKIAAINFHPSLLPNHQGGTPNRWVVANQEMETGITLHHLTENFDEGDMIFQTRIPLTGNEIWGDVEERVLEILPRAVRKLLNMLNAGVLERIPQDISKAVYEPSLKGKYSVINWKKPANIILSQIRAVKPKTGALSLHKGKKICVWSACKKSLTSSAQQSAGKVIDITSERYPVVACGVDDALILEKVVQFGQCVSSERLGLKYGDLLG